MQFSSYTLLEMRWAPIPCLFHNLGPEPLKRWPEKLFLNIAMKNSLYTILWGTEAKVGTGFAWFHLNTIFQTLLWNSSLILRMKFYRPVLVEKNLFVSCQGMLSNSHRYLVTDSFATGFSVNGKISVPDKGSVVI